MANTNIEYPIMDNWGQEGRFVGNKPSKGFCYDRVKDVCRVIGTNKWFTMEEYYNQDKRILELINQNNKLNIPKTLLHSVINTKNKYEIVDGDISVEFEGTEKTNGLVYIYIKTNSISHQLEAIEREVEGLIQKQINEERYPADYLLAFIEVLAIIKKYKEEV